MIRVTIADDHRLADDGDALEHGPALELRRDDAARDHSELALRAFGATLTRTADSVSISGPQSLHAIDAAVPGDLSSAAFFLCAAALFPGSNLVIDALGLGRGASALREADERSQAWRPWRAYAVLKLWNSLEKSP